jgi:hypothetical protein
MLFSYSSLEIEESKCTQIRCYSKPLVEETICETCVGNEKISPMVREIA